MNIRCFYIIIRRIFQNLNNIKKTKGKINLYGLSYNFIEVKIITFLVFKEWIRNKKFGDYKKLK